MRDLTPLLSPRSIAVVGASSDLTSLAGKPVRFIRDSGVDVAVYPVNPSHQEIGGYTAYPNPSALPEAPDVALVLVPASAVIETIEALGLRGTKSAIVVTSGFAEVDQVDGATTQRQLGEIARRYGMHLLGPNTLGVHDYVRGLPLSFVWYGRRASSRAGSVAVVSQSGSGMTSLCDRILDADLPLGLGIATGNEADLTLVDVLEHLAEDESVKVIATVFEEVRDGPRFLAVCQRLRDLGKPLIALKVGKTASGAEMVRSHTGSLAGSYPTLSSLLRQHGVLEVNDLDEIPATVASALLGKFPSNDAIAMVTNSGGAAAIAADRADELGVTLAELSPESQRAVAQNLPAFARGQRVSNPIDVTAQSMQRPFALTDIASALLADPGVGGVILAVPSGGGPDGVLWAERLIELTRESAKPLLTVILSGQESDRLRAQLRAGGVPVLSSPAAAAETLHRLRRLSRAPVSADFETRPAARSRAIPLPSVRTEYSTLKWLAQHGLAVAHQELAAGPIEAITAAEAMGYPVAVKVSSADIEHKTDVGGVILNLSDAESVARATDSVLASAAAAMPDAVIEGVTVSRMVVPVLELIIGMHRDPTFGTVVVLGLGGIWAEVLADATMRRLPLGPGEVDRMIDDLRGAPLLRGARGRPPVDAAAIEQVLSTLVRIADQHGAELSGVDLNPVAVTEDGRLVILDASVFASSSAPLR